MGFCRVRFLRRWLMFASAIEAIGLPSDLDKHPKPGDRMP